MKRINTSMNFDFSEARNFAYPSGKKLTVPNQVLSPAEMLARFSRGQAVDTSFLQPYYSSIELPQLERLDFTERQELLEENAELISSLKEQVSKSQAAKEKAAAKEALKRELEAENTEPPAPTSTPPASNA